MFQAQTTVQAKKADKYTQTLAKHFSKKVTVESSEGVSKIIFSMGTCTMSLNNDTIHLQCESLEKEGLDTVKEIISSHLGMLKELKSVSLEWQEETLTKD
ncbi:hypothetical protein A9Q79_01770 [Methylophaga sp. 42_25_T18]|nr:hypothetical protein A9Q79_01770 [Methylophaga sp. 42_25_T18]